jgi:hypothetical protein
VSESETEVERLRAHARRAFELLSASRPIAAELLERADALDKQKGED